MLKPQSFEDFVSDQYFIVLLLILISILWWAAYILTVDITLGKNDTQILLNKGEYHLICTHNAGTTRTPSTTSYKIVGNQTYDPIKINAWLNIPIPCNSTLENTTLIKDKSIFNPVYYILNTTYSYTPDNPELSKTKQSKDNFHISIEQINKVNTKTFQFAFAFWFSLYLIIVIFISFLALSI